MDEQIILAALDAIVRAIDALAVRNPQYAAQEAAVARHYIGGGG